MVKIDWRLALLSLITVPVGLFFFALMMRGSKESYENTVVKTKALNDTAVEYINGIEVIKAFGKAKTSYEKFVIACFVLAFDWRIGLVLVAGIALYVVFNTVMQHATKPVAPRKHKADEGLVTQVIDYVQGIAEVKNYSMTDDTAKKLEAAIVEKQKGDTTLEYAVIPWITMQNITTKMTGIVMAVLSLKFYFAGTMELLYCIMMMISAFMVYESLDSMSSFTALMRNIRIAVTQTKEILDMPPMDIDGEEWTPNKRNIELRGVSFSYDKRKIIDNVSLTIPEKTTTAFVAAKDGITRTNPSERAQITARIIRVVIISQDIPVP